MTGNRAARWEIMLHLSGFPDSSAARRAARILAADGEPTDLFWVGALAVEEGRGADIEATRRVLERQYRDFDPEGSPPTSDGPAFSAAYAAALGAYAGVMRGDRRRLADFESALARLPTASWTGDQPAQYLLYRVGQLLFDAGRTHDAERYFRTFQPYDYFYTTPAELYLGRIAEADGRREEAVTHYRRFVRMWRYADEPLRPQWEEARQALSRLTPGDRR